MASINLLPGELRQDLPIEWSKLLPKLILLGLIFFILIFSLVFFILISTLNSRIGNLDTKFMELQPETKQALELKKEINLAAEQIAALKSLEEKQTSWHDLLWDINNRIPQDLWLVNFKVSSPQTIMINGQCLDFNSIGLFLDQLNQLTLFSEIQLLRAETGDLGEETVYNFEFQAKLDEGSGK